MTGDLYDMPRRRAKRPQGVIKVAVDPAEAEAFRAFVEEHAKRGHVWLIPDGERSDLVLCTSGYWYRREQSERRIRNRRRRRA